MLRARSSLYLSHNVPKHLTASGMSVTVGFRSDSGEQMASWPKRTEDKSSTRRLRDYLRANFYLRNIAPGDKLVSHRELSKQLRISPTTALRLYEELENEGLLDTKERSGTFLKNVGIEADRPPREEEMFRLIRETAAKLISLEACPSQFSRLMQYYTGAAVREDFKIGFVAHSEAYELALRTLKKKDIPLSLVRISPDPLGTEMRYLRCLRKIGASAASWRHTCG